ncbi:hypothetical protein NF867_08625 [Solitalea sp. MAHUQ-68]|uniref:Uncharacterized protein n=1 Tax=Solitalea agri TaxID=2953739 RepID=A0A9X2F6S2_9SPHI|nr:hypothetical protein [Solitalea agri]MCO4292923.1 hypothetical protein [Solitalea agri]
MKKLLLFGLLFLIMIQFILGCNNYYYKVTQIDYKNQPSTDIQTLAIGRNVILHDLSSQNSFTLTNLNTHSSQDEVQFNVVSSSTEELNHDQVAIKNKGKLDKKQYSGKYNEMHIYVDDMDSLENEKYVLKTDRIEKINVIEFDKKKTSNKHLTTGLLIGGGVIIGFFVIAGISFAAVGVM